METETVKKIGPAKWLALWVVYLSIPLLAVVLAGDAGWWQAWAYGAIVGIAGVGGRFLAEKAHPGLLAERSRFLKVEGVMRWDKLLSPLMAVLIAFPIVIAAGLERRFGMGVGYGLGWNVAGLAVCACGYALSVWAMVENKFFSGLVRIQTERGHTTVQSGPYAYLRHPGYAGSLLGMLGMVLALDSGWGWLAAAVAMGVGGMRTALEDATLRQNLPGYGEYAKKTRWRLIPFIW